MLPYQLFFGMTWQALEGLSGIVPHQRLSGLSVTLAESPHGTNVMLDKASVLIEALPYIRRFYQKTSDG